MSLLDDNSGGTTAAQPDASSPPSYAGLLGPSPLDAYYGGSVPQATIDSLNRQRAINGLLGFFAAAGSAGQPSRLPTPTGVALARGVGGQLDAQRDFDQMAARNLLLGPQYQALQLENQGRGINNALGLMNLRGWQGILGGGGSPGTGVAPSSLAPPPAPGSPGAPQGMPVSAPGTSSQGVTAPTGSSSLLTGSGAPSSTSLLGGPPPSSGSSAPPSYAAPSSAGPVPILDPASLIARAQQYARFPAGLTTANQLFSMAQKMMPEGTILMSDGSVALPKGADQAMMTRALADKGFIRGADGLFHIDPGYVAGQAQLTSAQEWAKVAPQLYEKRHEPFDLRSPGSARYEVGPDGNARLVAQNPVEVTSVAPDGTPYRTWINPPVTGAGGSLLNPSPQAASTGTSLLGPVPQSNAGVDTSQPGWYLRAKNQPGIAAANAQPTSAGPSPSPGVTLDAQGRPVVQSGLSPLAESSAKARGTQLEEYGTTLQNNATNAVNGQFLIDQMRRESGNGAGWEPGRFADWGGSIRSVIQGALGDKYTPDAINEALGNYQSFQKNSMQLVTQATRAVSPRAAVQEMQMIREALPGSHLSSTGLRYIFDQLSANNDFMVAKNQTSDAWRGSHNGTLAGFEGAWNQSVSPFAFLAKRMSNDDFAAMASNLQKTPQGRALLARIQGEVGTVAKLGLFNGGGQ